MAKGSDDGDEGDGDEVAKAAMQVATPTNPNPTRVWSGGFSRQSCRVTLAVADWPFPEFFLDIKLGEQGRHHTAAVTYNHQKQNRGKTRQSSRNQMRQLGTEKSVG